MIWARLRRRGYARLRGGMRVLCWSRWRVYLRAAKELTLAKEERSGRSMTSRRGYVGNEIDDSVVKRRKWRVKGGDKVKLGERVETGRIVVQEEGARTESAMRHRQKGRVITGAAGHGQGDIRSDAVKGRPQEPNKRAAV